MQPPTKSTTVTRTGTLDGAGCGDHDVPFRFGRTPRSSAPYPFNTRQYVRLLVLRSRVQAGLIGADNLSVVEHGS